jgi:phosphoglycerate dehydrogenase-like enzyme
VVRKLHSSRSVNILIAHPAGEVMFQQLQASLPDARVDFYPTQDPVDIPAEVWQSCEILYTERTLPDPLLVPNLKWIQFHYAGIDFAATAPILHKPRLKVTTLSGVPALPMGEYALLMILSLGHRAIELREYQDQSLWPENRFDVLAPKELRYSTVGIIGYGSSGRQIARLVKSFGGRVLTAKQNPAQRKDNGYYKKGTGDPTGRFADQMFAVTQLRDMLSQCDFVVVSVPLTSATRNLISRDEMSAMKPGAYLIDISRGSVVDHDALYAALESGQIAGAALDVFPREPLPTDERIWSHPNVIVTPHLSGYSPYYWQDAIHLFQENISRYLLGKPLLNRFDVKRGY